MRVICMKSLYKDSLVHITYEFKYYIVFELKYRMKEIYGHLRTEIGMILRELSNRKDVEIINAEACSDHIHMYVSILPKLRVSSFMEYLKGKSTLIIFEKCLDNLCAEKFFRILKLELFSLKEKEYKKYIE